MRSVYVEDTRERESEAERERERVRESERVKETMREICRESARISMPCGGIRVGERTSSDAKQDRVRTDSFWMPWT